MVVNAGSRSSRNVVQLARPTLRETIARLAPGTALRDGLERILRGRTGALILIGYDDSVEAICDGGFELDVRYAPTRLRELSKMDGAVVLSSDGSRIVVHKEMGLVAQVFDEPALTALRGPIAVGHCRYSTTGASVWANAQPTFRSTGKTSLALGHNGNLINTRELAALLGGPGPGSAGIVATSDTDVLTALFVSDRAGLDGVDTRQSAGVAPGPASAVESAAAAVLPVPALAGATRASVAATADTATALRRIQGRADNTRLARQMAPL